MITKTICDLSRLTPEEVRQDVAHARNRCIPDDVARAFHIPPVMDSRSSSGSGATRSCESRDGKVRVLILEAKRVYRYTIPSFCAITMTLQHVVLKLEEETEEASILDAFVRVGDDGLSGFVMDRPLPSLTIILSACIVPVSEREMKHGK